MAGISFITVAVGDLEKALSFYRTWLGLADDAVAHGGDHAALTLDGDFTLVLYPRQKIAEAAGKPAQPSASEFILSREASDRAELDEIIAQGIAAGGTNPSPVLEADWGHSGFVLDPDGHLWEIVAFAKDGEQD